MTERIIVDLASGFGNQLFQYAAGMAFHHATGTQLYLNRSRGNPHSLRDYRDYMTSRKFGPDISDKEIYEKGFIWDTKRAAYDAWTPTEFVFTRPYFLIRGYLQYLPAILPILPQLRRELFEVCSSKFLTPVEPAGFIHVRRGDYLNPQYKLPVQTKDYFERGIKYVESKKTIRRWMMVSNDLKWCKEQQWTSKNIEFIDESDEVLLFWMMLHWKEAAIISNSSFSWWAAILGAHETGSPVIYPSVWHTEKQPNLFPAEWIKL
jgi:hypothetical protein